MELKYSKPKVIFIDVDNTLIIDDEPNQDLIEWMTAKRADGFKLVLWSMNGQDHAIRASIATGTNHLFDTIIDKPGYIVDDKGWLWTRDIEVLSPDIKVVKKKRRRPTTGKQMRINRGRGRSRL